MPKTDWKSLLPGQIVDWNGDTWIVAGTIEGEGEDIGLTLISANEANVEAGPTMYWPIDKKLQVQSVEFVADNMADYVAQVITQAAKYVRKKISARS